MYLLKIGAYTKFLKFYIALECYKHYLPSVFCNLFADGLLKARAKLRKAEDTSNLESEIDDTKSRKRKIPKKFVVSDTSDEEVSVLLPRPAPITRNYLNAGSHLFYLWFCKDK